MGENIQLNNPQEVLAYISRESELLNQYAELINLEAKELLSLENLVNEAIQLITSRKRGLHVAIEQTKRQDDSDAKQQALKGLQNKLEKCEAQARTVIQCSDDLISIRQDYAYLVKNTTAISDNASFLSTKIQQLIEKIINAI